MQSLNSSARFRIRDVLFFGAENGWVKPNFEKKPPGNRQLQNASCEAVHASPGRACGWSLECCGFARPHFSKFPVCGGKWEPSFPDEPSDPIPQSWRGATATQTAPSAQISAIHDAPSANPDLHGEPPECETSRGNLAACGTLVTERAQ